MTTIKIARQYIGKLEKPNNSGFQDPEMEKDMIAIGWFPGASWCALFQKMIFLKANPQKTEFEILFNAGAVKTFQNFKKANYPILQKPVIGALVIWQHYENGIAEWQGHAGLVSNVINDHVFQSIEGNGSATGSRNGDRVVEKTRTLEVKKTGLNILGFVVI